jgi:hypothetical protein
VDCRPSGEAVLTYISVPVRGEYKILGNYRPVVFWLFSLVIPLLLFLAPPARADALEDAARQLAQRITGALPPYVPAFLAVQNASSLSDAQTSNVRSALQAALEKAGFKFSTDSHSQGQIRVTLSESLAGYLWVAEIRRGDATTVLMISIEGGKLGGTRTAASLVIRHELLWEQEDAILDVAFVAKGNESAEMRVLERGQFSSYSSKGGAWVHTGVTPIPKLSAWPRESRGLLYSVPELQGVSLQGEDCRFDARRVTGGWVCQPTRAQQPLAPGMEAVLNGKKGPRWFSAATFQADGKPVVIISGNDAKARLYDAEGAEALATFGGWGSEIASVRSGCGSGWQLLVTGKGDWAAPDTIQAFEIHGRQATAVSVAQEFSGPMTVLHNSEDSKTAIGIVKNLVTNHYEAYRLTVSCER